MTMIAAGLGAELLGTLEDLAGFGEKRVGSGAGHAAARYLEERMTRLGLAGVHYDAFSFPRHDVDSAALALFVGGETREAAFAVLEASGAGVVEAALVYAGTASDAELERLPLAGKIALVDRNPVWHRSTQYQKVAERGAAAMIFRSTAPANLHQVGSVRRAFEAMGPIPAVTIGAVDGEHLQHALAAGVAVRARLAVAATVSRGRGGNVIGVLDGDGEDTLVVGAHYDTWFAGSTDNGAGVAAMLALAARRRHRRRRHRLTFVAWDGEEIALYGGYHFLRRAQASGRLPLAVIDFETPAALGAQAYGLARSAHEPLERALTGVGLHELFALNLPMDLVPELFGGVIPTDVQGLYRGGTPSVATACDSPYYHTSGDTPDKVDLARLEETVLAFDRALDLLDETPRQQFTPRDPALWRAELALRRDGDDLVVGVGVVDGAGRPCAAAPIEATLFEDDFFEVAVARARADDAGRAQLVFAGRGAGAAERRFVHVTAGPRWPLVEVVRGL